MIWTVLGWVWVVIAVLLFFFGITGFINPQWVKDAKTGKVPGRFQMLMTAWFGPALFGAFAFGFFGLADDSTADSPAPSNAAFQTITASGMGAAYPFTIESALIRCERGLLPVVKLDGKEYGLTGASSGMGFEQLTSDNPLWRKTESGANAGLGNVISAAQALCSK